MAMLEISRRLDRSRLDLQLILIYGRNQKLAKKLRDYKSRVPMLIEGFTSEVPYYMHLSDFFIGKPGPGSISEALSMRLPVIVEHNAWTLPQKRYNADWILEKQVGLAVSDFRKIEEALETLLPQNFRRYRANASAQKSEAVFEIPEILERLF